MILKAFPNDLRLSPCQQLCVKMTFQNLKHKSRDNCSIFQFQLQNGQQQFMNGKECS